MTELETSLTQTIAQLTLDVRDLESKRDMLKRMVLSYGKERMGAYNIAIENSYFRLTEFYNDQNK